MERSVAPLLAASGGARSPCHCTAGGPSPSPLPIPHTHTALVAGPGTILQGTPPAPGSLHKPGGAEPLTDPEHTGDGGGLGGTELHSEKYPDPHVSLEWGHPSQ